MNQKLNSGAPVSIVAAVARNGVIGAEGDMPWRLPSDLKRFRALTMGKPVVMGRRTFETLGRPLTGRTNIVVTRDRAYRAEGASVVHSLEEALNTAVGAPGGREEIMVIGGGEIYAQAMDRAATLYITHIDAEPAGDTRFPAIEPRLWRVVAEEPIGRGEKDTAEMRFVVYRRV